MGEAGAVTDKHTGHGYHSPLPGRDAVCLRFPQDKSEGWGWHGGLRCCRRGAAGGAGLSTSITFVYLPHVGDTAIRP